MVALKPIRLGVNIDHVATLREVRKARYPDVVEAMHLCERGGADQITVHLREDRRHIQDLDVERLLECSLLPVNLEMAFTEEMIERALKWRPHSVTLVPERREEMTTESGLDLSCLQKNLSSLSKLRESLRVVGFIDPDLSQVSLAQELNLDGVEFHTGPYSEAFEMSLRGRDNNSLRHQIQRLIEASRAADNAKIEVKAGHGLTIQNVSHLCEISEITEFNIGHSIVARSLLMGLEAAVREMKTHIQR
ncbi:MAG: pyridoxine 5'-phosphate synthase [Deltaproteobacteria bacterium CG11_big_fil_rev_8_21_14_0_20_45_16]|nr:MAG: pyridoxine 5'-phosphate synthase [Deltaproteobacteria bacterium CG11_big_fil_rev_8_21_14_0_20_45_16]